MPRKKKEEIEEILGIDCSMAIPVSAKTGEGTAQTRIASAAMIAVSVRR